VYVCSHSTLLHWHTHSQLPTGARPRGQPQLLAQRRSVVTAHRALRWVSGKSLKGSFIPSDAQLTLQSGHTCQQHPLQCGPIYMTGCRSQCGLVARCVQLLVPQIYLFLQIQADCQSQELISAWETAARCSLQPAVSS